MIILCIYVCVLIIYKKYNQYNHNVNDHIILPLHNGLLKSKTSLNLFYKTMVLSLVDFRVKIKLLKSHIILPLVVTRSLRQFKLKTSLDLLCKTILDGSYASNGYIYKTKSEI